MRPIFLPIVILIACLVPLVLGAERILLLPLPGGLPLGNLLAACALVAGSAIPLMPSRPRSWLRWTGSVIMMAAILWLPIGVFLSGDATLSFNQDPVASAFFWRFTAGLGISILALIAWSLVEARLASRQ